MSDVRIPTTQTPVAWRCTRAEPDECGVWTKVKYAKTRVDMLILKDKGYACTPIYDDGEQP